MNIQTFLKNILGFLDNIILPALIAVAGLFFIWNAARYFIIGGANPESQEKARGLALWGILAFVLILSLWGVVNLLVAGFGLGAGTSITPDYIIKKTGP